MTTIKDYFLHFTWKVLDTLELTEPQWRKLLQGWHASLQIWEAEAEGSQGEGQPGLYGGAVKKRDP